MRYLLLYFTFLLAIPSWSQQYLPMEHFGVEDGLSYRRVLHIYQDTEGFLWFCTEDGLNRYDGVEWKVYRNVVGDASSIPGNITNWVFEDNEGNLIIDNSDDIAQYAFFDKKKDEFRKLEIRNYNRANELVLRGPFKTKEGDIIAIGKLTQLDKYYNVPEDSPESYLLNYLGDGIFEFSQELTFSVEDSPILSKPASKSERYWMTGIGHSELLDIEKKSLTRYNHTSFGNYAVPADPKGTFWYPARNQSSEQLFDTFQLPPHILLENWENFRLDNHGNIWLKEKNNRMFKYDIRLKHIKIDGEFDINYSSFSKYFEDNDGTLWMPGKFGVDKLRKESNYFEHYLNGTFSYENVSDTKEDKQSVKGIVTYPIVEASDGKLRILADHNNLYTINPDKEKNYTEAELIGIENGMVKLAISATVTTMLPASNGQLWIENGSISLYNPVSKKTRRFPLPVSVLEKQHIVHGEKVRSAQMDESGKIWFVTRNDRLLSFDTLSKKYTLYPDVTFPRGVVGIGEGQMWVSTDSLLLQFDKDKKLSKSFKLPNEVLTKNNYELYQIVPYQQKVWIATRKGLLVFDPESEEFEQFTTKDGLPHNIVYTIVPDGNNLWMGTHHGLCRFNIMTKEVKNFYVTDGLTHNEFNRKSATKTRDGKLYFGGLNGVNAFYPEVLDSLTRLEGSRLAWTGFSKLDAKLDTINNYRKQLLDETKPVEIFYGDKSYSFRFALLNFIKPSENTYSYYLEGFEKYWNFAGNASFANYPSLPPGEYTLRVKAKDSRGNAGSNELAIPIIVHGAWWSTWWAIGSFAFLFLSTVFTFYKWRTSSLKKQRSILEQTVKERTLELQTQKERAEQSEKIKEQFLANMSHEIRTPMHAISGMTNILARNAHPKAQDKFLQAIQQSSGNLMVILNDILDLSKIEAGKIEIENIPISLSAVIENVISLSKMRASEKGLTIQSSIDTEIPKLVNGDPTRLSQILLNLMGNAIKFTEKGSVQLTVNVVDDQLRFAVQDSGIGIPAAKLERIFGTFEQVNETITRKYGGTGLGLSITKQLVELQNGKIWVDSKENIGSTFFFELPLQSVEANAKLEGQITEAQVKEMAAALSGIHILLVEDNEFNVMVACDDLSYYINEVKIGFAENGKVAIQEFETGNYDLILMDIQMPELSGYDAAVAIRALESSNGTAKPIPIIAMTASLLKSEIALCFETGMDNYIPKPYKIEELIGAIYKAYKKPKL